jgi:hypothetical protein
MKDTSLSRVGGFSGFAVAILSILYAVAYLFITPAAQRGSDLTGFYTSFTADPTGRQLANLCFVISGILGPFVVVGVCERLRGLSEGWARWALVMGTLAIVATGLHGFYNLIVTPIQAGLYTSGDAATRAAIAVARSAPLPIDPVEFFSFGVTGLWALVVGLLILRGTDASTLHSSGEASSGQSLPRWLGYVALVAGVDMLALFFADVAGAGTLILLTGGLASLILGPAMWAGFGRVLLRDAGAAAPIPAMSTRGT